MAKTNNVVLAARQFAKEWSGKGYEKGETQRFWMALLHDVLGVENPVYAMEFEIPVKTITKEKGSDFIDGYITATKVLIEQKGSHVDLRAKSRQSDGQELTPYQQARRYAAGLPVSMTPRWIVACNFQTFEVHDMEHPN
ncbi:MAG: class I SAM-dependent DNA methyltransferase, partial [Spirochaetales bacterium]|nr:class I SAM-dependent DNA methyltransferase [Spirochaetales bacterium]